MYFNFLFFFISILDILPHNAESYPATKEFLMKVVDILLDYIKATNDRNAKVLDFRHPSEMIRLLDLEIPDTGLTLQQLLIDCSTTLKYQVRTGKSISYDHFLQNERKVSTMILKLNYFFYRFIFRASKLSYDVKRKKKEMRSRSNPFLSLYDSVLFKYFLFFS